MLLFLIGHACGAEVSVIPSSQYLTEGDPIILNISIDPAGALIAGAQLNLEFDQSKLSITSITEGNIFKQNSSSTFFNSGEIDNLNGRVTNILGSIIGLSNVSTEGIFALVTFEPTGSEGLSGIDITNAKISDPDGNIIPLTVFNGSVTITVPPENIINSGAGGNGGGAGGTSGENQSNILEKEKYDAFIKKDEPTSYSFKKAGPIISINITGNVNAGEITTSVELLRNRSSLVRSSVERIVYKNVNIWVGTYGFATQKNIKHAEIVFKVEKAWIELNNIDPDSIAMNRYNDTWEILPTEKVREDDEFVYFESRTVSFSPFAITGAELIKENTSIIIPVPSAIESPVPQEQKSNEIENEPESQDSTKVLISIGGVMVLMGSVFAFKKEWWMEVRNRLYKKFK